uniref:Carbamoyl phosphate synthase small chain n=1 Tax=Laurencieae sp. TaxID=2007162 RepID=A0A1Z1M2V2_9FLOR|nr:carbamoyl phosphate synthase small subunit [Laurencieae sp.]
MLSNLYPTLLYLQDGTSYKGWSFFKMFAHAGEIVFNTGMTGYQEILTDPSYAGQMVVFTYPEIGNTGLNSQDSESNMVHVQALIAKNISCLSSSWRSSISLKNFLISKRLPHIFGIDTRSLTKYIRLNGVMSAVILDSTLDFNLKKFKFNDINAKNFIAEVTTQHIYYTNCNVVDKTLNSCFNFKNNRIKSLPYVYRIVVIDFGVKLNILRKLFDLGCSVFVVPATCDYNTIIKYRPDGLLLSNGPGDPLSAKFSIDTVRKLLYFSNVPIFGICMGHQILNLAIGAHTFKLRFGHRGLNHPSGYLNYSEITSQNHGFAVSKESLLRKNLSELLKCNSWNLNDLTVSSTLHENFPMFSVQYHPEASPGPRDSDYLFKVFVKLIDFTKFIN